MSSEGFPSMLVVERSAKQGVPNLNSSLGAVFRGFGSVFGFLGSLGLRSPKIFKPKAFFAECPPRNLTTYAMLYVHVCVVFRLVHRDPQHAGDNLTGGPWPHACGQDLSQRD